MRYNLLRSGSVRLATALSLLTLASCAPGGGPTESTTRDWTGGSRTVVGADSLQRIMTSVGCTKLTGPVVGALVLPARTAGSDYYGCIGVDTALRRTAVLAYGVAHKAGIGYMPYALADYENWHVTYSGFYTMTVVEITYPCGVESTTETSWEAKTAGYRTAYGVDVYVPGPGMYHVKWEWYGECAIQIVSIGEWANGGDPWPPPPEGPPGGGGGSPGGGSVTMTGLTISPSTALVQAGTMSSGYTVTAWYSNGSHTTVTDSGVTWSTSDAEIVSLDDLGTFLGQNAGIASFRAGFGGFIAPVAVAVFDLMEVGPDFLNDEIPDCNNSALRASEPGIDWWCTGATPASNTVVRQRINTAVAAIRGRGGFCAQLADSLDMLLSRSDQPFRLHPGTTSGAGFTGRDTVGKGYMTIHQAFALRGYDLQHAIPVGDPGAPSAIPIQVTLQMMLAHEAEHLFAGSGGHLGESFPLKWYNSHTQECSDVGGN